MTGLRNLLVLLWCISLAGCGWQLRGSQDSYLPDQLAVITEHPFAPLTIALNQAMQERSIESDSNAALQLHLGHEVLDKRTVAVTRIGSAAQYEMRLSVPFRYWRPEEQRGPGTQTIHATRIFDFAPSDTVAKREEERTLLQEMRRELALRILHMGPAPARHE